MSPRSSGTSPRRGPALYGWALRQLGVQRAHETTRGSKNLIVAVIDIGYRTHSDLEPHLWIDPKNKRSRRHGWDFVDDDASLEYRGVREESSEYFRGHHGFVGGEVAHLAPECPIMMVRVGYGNPESWERGIRYAVDHGAKILVTPHGYISGERANGIPLFYQGTDFSYPWDNPGLREAMDYAFAHGCLIFKSSGDNRGRRVVTFQAGFDAVFTVGSTNRKGWPADICPDCDYVEAGAPGGERSSGRLSDQIRGYGGDQNFINFTGGCMASGFAGGVGALVWSRFPHLENEQLRQVLRNTTRPVSGLVYDPYGWEPNLGFGILDARRAVTLKDSQLCRDVKLLPSTVRFKNRRSRKTLKARVRNRGVFDAEKAIVVAYDGDPQKPADRNASRARPASPLQIGHTVFAIRGFQQKEILINLVSRPKGTVWFETFTLDRNDAGHVHRARNLIVAPGYSSKGPSGAAGKTRRGPFVNNLADQWLAMGQRVCLAKGENIQRQPSTTNLGISPKRTSDRISSGRPAWMTENEHSVYILITGSNYKDFAWTSSAFEKSKKTN